MRRKRILEEWNKMVSGLPETVRLQNPVVLNEFRRYYFLGAYGLYSIIMRQIQEDREPTTQDMNLINDIDRELKEFISNQERLGLGRLER